MKLGEETAKNHERRKVNGDYLKYFKGKGIDVGYRGYRSDIKPVANSIGVDTDYPGYDGVHLPFDDESLDFVHSSHCLEHIPTISLPKTFEEWFRVLKVGGYMIITVPHQFLYEKRTNLPSRYNLDHKRFYTPFKLMWEVEMNLKPNTYRVRRLMDNDLNYDYDIPPEKHPYGCYEIELIIEKIKPPEWELADV